jgi:hypothetical protein
MKRLCVATVIATMMGPMGTVAFADDVIPSVSREEMSAYKNAFGSAIAESRKAEAANKAPKDDSFGGKVSEAARGMKGEIKQDNKNFGAWVSKQRAQRPDDTVSTSKGNSDAAKSSTASGRPKGKESSGNGNNGHGGGKKDK